MCEYKLCIVPINRKKTFECNISKTFDFGTSLEKVYPLLQIIFEKLPYEDLKSAALVNNTWGRYGNEELQKRNGASWISLVESKTSPLTLKNSFNFKYDNVAFGLIFYDSSQIRLNKYVCVHDDTITRITFSEYLINEIVPRNTDFWAFSCSHVYSPALNKEYKCLFTGVLLPEILNIKIKQFITSSDKIDKFFEENSFKNEYVHCIFMFTLSYPNNIVKKFMKELLNREDIDKIAIAGGVISGGIKPFQKIETKKVFKSNTLFGITVTQEKNKTAEFDSYSVVISDNIDFEEKLLEFKQSIELRERSFAIRICCSAKDNKDIETVLFNKIFPKTFMIGLDADGEIGWDKFDSWQPEQDAPEKKKKKLNRSLCHQYTTVIIIMTWGKMIQFTNQ